MAYELEQKWQQLRNRVRSGQVGKFFAWWLGELRQAMPASWQEKLQHAMRRVSFTLGEGLLSLAVDENRRLSDLDAFPLSQEAALQRQEIDDLLRRSDLLEAPRCATRRPRDIRSGTEMTVKLARSMGMSESEIVHIRRGALLHDIGKMAISDRVLLTPDPLNKDEYEIMCKHPTYAYEMLLPISFLRHALNIPYCHHEKWDGSGYPRGLKGMDIPFAARVFAVIDVWDALISDRPYRKALPTDEVRQRIKDDSGKHFDPNVVKAFLELKDLSV